MQSEAEIQISGTRKQGAARGTLYMNPPMLLSIEQVLQTTPLSFFSTRVILPSNELGFFFGFRLKFRFWIRLEQLQKKCLFQKENNGLSTEEWRW